MSTFFDAFISYGRPDSKALAMRLYDRLTARGFKIWFDQNDIPLAVNFQNQIDEGIEKSHNFIFIIAPHAINSSYCRKEIERAVTLRKRLIPLFHVGEIDRATWQQRIPAGTEADWQTFKEQGQHNSFDNMHPAIAAINWIYCQDAVDNFDETVQALIEVMQTQADYVAQHTRWLVAALAWERHYRPTHALLTDQARIQAVTWLKHRFQDAQPPCEPTDLQCEFICESIKNANNLMTEVFLSYVEADKPLAEQLKKGLMRQGITVWHPKMPAQTEIECQQAIYQGIEGADNIVHLASPASLPAQACQQILTYAKALHKRVITLRTAEVATATMPVAIRDLSAAELNETEGIPQLISILNQEAYYYQQHKILLVKALKWERQGHNSSILLRGHSLQHFDNWLKIAKQHPQHPPVTLQIAFVADSGQQPAHLTQEVFIAYARSNADFARRLNDALQRQGKTTWFDQESIPAGYDFQQEIYQGIEQSNNFLFIISPAAIESPYCQDEIHYAQQLNKRFIPLLYQPVSTLPPALGTIQWIDFNRHEKDFYANFSELIRVLETDREYVHQHTQWAHRAKDWLQNNKDPDLLLRGSELMIAEQWLQTAEQHKKYPVPTTSHQAYIAASQAALQAKEKKEKRRLMVLRTLLGWSVIALMLTITLGIWAYQERNHAMRSQSLFLAALSQQETNKGHATHGILLALEALPHSLRYPDRPLVPEARWALMQAMENLYERHVFKGHQAQVDQVVFNPAGTLIATAARERTARLWHLDQPLYRLQGHNAAVSYIGFSPDGRKVVTAARDNTAKLWDAATGQLRETFQGHNDVIYHADFSPDGQQLITASWDNTARLWEVQQGQMHHVFTGHQKGVRYAAFSPDGQRIITVSDDNTAKLWRVADKQLLHTLTGHTAPIFYADFSPRGDQVVTASADKTARLWTVPSGQLVHVLKGHTHWVYRAQFSPDGHTIVTASRDNTARLWNTGSGQMRAILLGHKDKVYRATFSPDGHEVATASADGTARLWDVASGFLLATLGGHEDSVRDIAYHPNGEDLVTASADHTVRMWHTADRQLQHLLTDHTNWVWFAVYSPDNQWIVTTSDDQTARLWRTDNGELHAVFQHAAEVNHADFNTQGTQIVTAAFDGSAKVWSIAGKQPIHILTHAGKVYHAVFSPDDRYIATASEDKTARLWNSQTGQLIHTLVGHTADVFRVAFSPDGRYLVTASAGKAANLWDVASGALLHKLMGHTGKISRALFSPNGHQVITISDDTTARLWDTAKGELLHVLTGHTQRIAGVAFDSTGQRVITTSYDKTARVWTIPSGQQQLILKGHEGAVLSAHFSPNGQQILTTSKDNTARFWDGRTGKLQTVLRGHRDEVNYAVYRPDGHQITTVSRDNTARLWRVSKWINLQTMIDKAWMLVPRRLTDEQRQRFFLGE